MTATSQATRVVNPYARKAPQVAQNGVQNNVNEAMGRQSQQRISNQHKRKFKLASNNSPNKKSGQQTLFGGNAFEAKKDCQVCKARFLATFIEGYRVPNRAHHQLCIRNTKTRGKGELSEQQKLSLEDNKRHKALVSPIAESEKWSSQHLPRDGGRQCFAPRVAAKMTVTTTTTIDSVMESEQELSPAYFCKAVSTLVADSSFVEKHKAKQAPLAMMAFANEVADKIIRQKRTSQCFNGLAMEVPACDEADDNPHCHSIIGQKLLLVDWEKTHGIQVPCPDGSCQGTLANDRTNCSKNKTLFPVFNLDGPPSWCIVMTMVCRTCRRRFDANEGEVLVNSPDYAADDYPVETNYAFPNFASHLSRATTDVFSSLMLTYGNGEMCSKLLYNCLNRCYIRRLKSYHSKAKEKKEIENGKALPEYVEKDGVYIKTYPPLGDTICDMFDEAASNKTNPWRISDYDRHTREIQSVKCEGIFCQDHAFELVKNYRKRLGAIAAWTCGTQTGEVAAVALVPSTKTEDFAHGAMQLTKRPNFKQQHMCSDTWPHKERFWIRLGVEGRLGLFHFEQRIIRTLRKKHIDCSQAITDLLASLYIYYAPDYEKLLAALKEGKLSNTGKKYSSEDIAELKSSKLFRERYSKYLRKVIHEPQTIVQNLDDWFCKYKVTSTDPINKPAGGRLDPLRMVPLFTVETKVAIEACKEKAKYLADPLPLEDMYDKILPNPNSTHQLTEFLSKRGESKLEAFHDRLAHFANCGMRNRLADNLNLAGTARFNIAIRHKRSLMTQENPQNQNQLPVLIDRKTMPATWEKVVPFFNYSELWYINALAKSNGCPYPFPNAETLPEDNGERFYSQCMTTLKEIGTKQRGDEGECLCHLCDTAVANTNMSRIVNRSETTNNNRTRQPSPPPERRPVNPNAHTHGGRAPAVAAQIQQQQQQHQQHPKHHFNLPLIAPQPHPMLLPMWCFPQMLTSAPACCWKYKEWLMRPRRVGRPPHHPLCSKR